MDQQVSPILPTVSRAFLEDWLVALRAHCPPQQLAQIMQKIGLSQTAHPQERVTHDQIVQLYQITAVGTGDEMMGLWSRPIRSGALKLMCTSIRGASSLSAALFRFTSFWNLLLDDFRLELDSDEQMLRVALQPLNTQPPQRFGHMLMLKLLHGIASWMAGRELPLQVVCFGFDRPEFAADYPVLFPAPIQFAQDCSSITFDGTLAQRCDARSDTEMQEFLIRAPRDWIFTGFREHSLALRIREQLLRSDGMSLTLHHAADDLNLTPRTLIRRLDVEGTSFQAIKDGLRRDIAIRDLTQTQHSIEAISQDIGFGSAASFHRAFKRWTNATPSVYRNRKVSVAQP